MAHENRGDFDVTADGRILRNGVDIGKGLPELWVAGTTYNPPDLVRKFDGTRWQLFICKIANNDSIFVVGNWEQKSFTATEVVALFSAVSPLLYNGGGIFSIQAATGGQDGFLISTDWQEFKTRPVLPWIGSGYGYKIYQLVKQNGILYSAIDDHFSSGSFDTDVQNGHWLALSYGERPVDPQTITPAGTYAFPGSTGRHDILLDINSGDTLVVWCQVKNATTVDVFAGNGDPISNTQGMSDKINIYMSGGDLVVENQLLVNILASDIITKFP